MPPKDVTPASALADYFKYEAAAEQLQAEIDNNEWVKQVRADIDAIKAKMVKIEAYMLNYCNEEGLDKFETGAGTFTKAITVHYNIASYESLTNWMSEQESIPFHFFNKKLTGKSIDEYADLNEGALPPGVSTFQKVAPKFKAKG